MAGEGRAAFSKTAAEMAEATGRKKLDQVNLAVEDLRGLVKKLGDAWKGETAEGYVELLDNRRAIFGANSELAKRRLDDLKKAIEAHETAEQRAQAAVDAIEPAVWADVDARMA